MGNKEINNTADKLNKDYVFLNAQIRELNAKRYELFKKFQELNPDVEIHIMKTPSIYFDLYGKDVDEK